LAPAGRCPRLRLRATIRGSCDRASVLSRQSIRACRMMLKPTIALVASGLAAAAAPALANDSTAELATGGLIFVRNENVEMRSEDLTISTKEISVRYRFFNNSDKSVTVLVAFPLPEITIEGSDSNISLPTEDPVNLLAFTTAVNGKPVTTK